MALGASGNARANEEICPAFMPRPRAASSTYIGMLVQDSGGFGLKIHTLRGRNTTACGLVFRKFILSKIFRSSFGGCTLSSRLRGVTARRLSRQMFAQSSFQALSVNHSDLYDFMIARCTDNSDGRGLLDSLQFLTVISVVLEECWKVEFSSSSFFHASDFLSLEKFFPLELTFLMDQYFIFNSLATQKIKLNALL